MTVYTVLFMAPPPGGGGGGGLESTLLMFALIIGIFYFMILRPQQKRQKEREKMMESIRKGDKIVTAGGLHGKIAGLDEKTFLLEVGENVKLKFDRTAIASVVREGDATPKEPK